MAAAIFWLAAAARAQSAGGAPPLPPASPAEGRISSGDDPASLGWDNLSREAIDRDLASKDPHVRARALGDLLNTRFKREEVVALLQSYLGHPDPEIRFQAAQLLFILGSDSGREVMVSLLQAGARGENVAERLVTGAAQALYQYRQPFEPQLLFAAYAATKASELKSLMVLLQVPEARSFVADALSRNIDLESNARNAGILRLGEEQVLAKLRLISELPRPYGRMVAHWALAQITGSEADLGYVVELAEQRAGLSPKPSGYDQLLGLDAVRLLSTVKSPQATSVLRAITKSSTATGDNMVFNIALASLFYVQKDYSYVDAKIAEELRADIGKPAPSIVWKIAAERRTPELEQLAVVKNAAAYRQHFILERGRPPEYWIYQYLSNIPAEALPPVRQ